MEQIGPGLVGQIEMVVREESTAQHLGSGNVAVLATPEMIRLMEKAAVAAVTTSCPMATALWAWRWMSGTWQPLQWA